MQSVDPIPHVQTLPWYAHVLAIILASLLGGGFLGTLLTLIFTRNRTKSEIHRTDAEAVKILAEVRSLDVQTNITAGDAVTRFIAQLSLVEGQKAELRERIEQLEAENEAYEQQIRWAKGVFAAKGLTWDEEKT